MHMSVCHPRKITIISKITHQIQVSTTDPEVGIQILLAKNGLSNINIMTNLNTDIPMENKQLKNSTKEKQTEGQQDQIKKNIFVKLKIKKIFFVKLELTI